VYGVQSLAKIHADRKGKTRKIVLIKIFFGIRCAQWGLTIVVVLPWIWTISDAVALCNPRAAFELDGANHQRVVTPTGNVYLAFGIAHEKYKKDDNGDDTNLHSPEFNCCRNRLGIPSAWSIIIPWEWWLIRRVIERELKVTHSS